MIDAVRQCLGDVGVGTNCLDMLLLILKVYVICLPGECLNKLVQSKLFEFRIMYLFFIFRRRIGGGSRNIRIRGLFILT